jgi:hypothetical protein
MAERFMAYPQHVLLEDKKSSGHEVLLHGPRSLSDRLCPAGGQLVPNMPDTQIFPVCPSGSLGGSKNGREA